MRHCFCFKNKTTTAKSPQFQFQENKIREMSQWLNPYKAYEEKAMITWQETLSALILLKIYEPERLPSLAQASYSQSLGI